jgi:hypothetical protein
MESNEFPHEHATAASSQNQNMSEMMPQMMPNE